MYNVIRSDVLGLWFCEAEDAMNISEELRRSYARKAYGWIEIATLNLDSKRGKKEDKRSLLIVRDVYYSAKLSAWQRFARFWRHRIFGKGLVVRQVLKR